MLSFGEFTICRGGGVLAVAIDWAIVEGWETELVALEKVFWAVLGAFSIVFGFDLLSYF